MDHWNLNAWESALESSPVLTSDYQSSGRLLKELLGSDNLKPVTKLFKAVRDLQIIRPKIFGTLEFRADPSQPKVSDILALVSLRLGVAKSVVDGAKVKKAFSMERMKWWELAFQTVVTPERDVLELAARSLDKISSSYKGYLEPYYEYLRNKSA